MTKTLDQMLANEKPEVVDRARRAAKEMLLIVDQAEGLTAALERISAARDDDLDNQVNREILRYWNERVAMAGDNADELRSLRAMIFQWLQDNGTEA